MTGSLTGINYASLFPASSSSSSAGSGVLQALYDSSSSSSGTSDVNPIIALQIAQANQTTDVANEAKTPTVQLAIQAFTKAVDSATSVKSLLSNPNFLNVFLTANGLGSEAGYPALAQQALLSDPTNSSSLASQLQTTNSAWLNTVQTYNFFKNGLAAVQNPKVISTLASGYAEVQWRESLDKQTPGLSNALYFLANASSFTSADDILGNAVARTVVTTAFGIPEQIAYQPLEAQEQAITSHLDLSKLSNPQYVQSLTDQYLVQLQASSFSSSSSASVTSLIA